MADIQVNIRVTSRLPPSRYVLPVCTTGCSHCRSVLLVITLHFYVKPFFITLHYYKAEPSPYCKFWNINLPSLCISAVGKTMSPTPTGGDASKTSSYAILIFPFWGLSTPWSLTVSDDVCAGILDGVLLVTLPRLSTIRQVSISKDFCPGL